ncbi:hypothetical protein EBQ93_04550, partial [bacterium]|nr:hypothetical protein [bacterium]
MLCILSVMSGHQIFSGASIKKYKTTAEEIAQRDLIQKEYDRQKTFLDARLKGKTISQEDYAADVKKLKRRKHTDFARIALNYGDPQRREDKKVAAKKQRNAMTPEQKEKARLALIASRKRHRPEYNARERARQRAAFEKMSPAEKRAKREKHIEYARIWYQKKLSEMTPEELELERKKRAEAQKKYMSLKKVQKDAAAAQQLFSPATLVAPVQSDVAPVQEQTTLLGSLDPASLLLGAATGGGRLSTSAASVDSLERDRDDARVTSHFKDEEFDAWYYNQCAFEEDEEALE